MTGVLLLKGLADLTFGGAFLWYLVKFLVSIGLAFVAILCGIKWRKSKMRRQTAWVLPRKIKRGNCIAVDWHRSLKKF